jgi:acyl-coenzyme A synthetase/AMP-(fatty) acid ligase
MRRTLKAFVTSLPNTRSGQIVRRVLRAQEFGRPTGDVSTLRGVKPWMI